MCAGLMIDLEVFMFIYASVLFSNALYFYLLEHKDQKFWYPSCNDMKCLAIDCTILFLSLLSSSYILSP